jgi:hypothetical protein
MRIPKRDVAAVFAELPALAWVTELFVIVGCRS